MRERWYPAATRHPGPSWKVRGSSAVRGFVGHSAEGPLHALFSELARTDRDAAWHFSIAKDGRVYQHFAVDQMVWHGGSARAHQMVGAEHEGVAGQPLTAAQRDASVALVRWLGAEWGWGTLKRRVNLWEHREVSDRVTQCPSGRIPWAAYVSEEPMSNAYIVTRGDTLGAIAQRFGTTVSKLAQINAIADPNRIEVGQVLRLDDAAPLPINLPLVHAVKTQLATATAAIDQARAVLDRGTP